MSADPEDIMDAIRKDIDPKTLGLYPKFDIINREKGELVTDPCFVLNPVTDPLARVAIRAYAWAALQEGYGPLAADLTAMLTKVELEANIMTTGAAAAPHTYDDAMFDILKQRDGKHSLKKLAATMDEDLDD